MRPRARAGQVSGRRPVRWYRRRRLESRRQYVVFVALVVILVAAGLVLGRSRRPPEKVLEAVPRDAWLVVTADVAALRQSPLAQPLLGASDGGAAGNLPGVGPLATRCGFDPVARLHEIALASPEGGERGDFGIAFTGDLTRDELSSCAEKIIVARGGRPATSAHDGFTVVEDTGDGKHARVAYRDGGPFLVGRGAWLDSMMDAVLGKVDRARAEHAALREALAPKGAPPPTVVLTALLPQALREKLKGELGSELGSDADKTYAAVLSVDRAGLAISTGGAGSTTQVAAELRCEDAAACEEVKKLIERKRLALSGNLFVRLVGLGPLLDSLTVEAKGSSLSVRAQAPTGDLARGIQQALDFRAAPRPAPAPAPAASAPPPAAAGPDGGVSAR